MPGRPRRRSCRFTAKARLRWRMSIRRMTRARSDEQASGPALTLRGNAAVDLAPHQRDRPLIDRRGIPGLDRSEIRLARLVARAGAPAMGAQEGCRRVQRIGGDVEIAGAVRKDV